MDANEAMKKLKEGNMRFVNSSPCAKDFTAQRKAIIAGQKPYATILACSDSRVVANYIFDTGLGEVFIVKNAGNIADDDITLGTIEYGVKHLHTPLLVVLGHELCGAVNATCGCRGETDEGHIKSIVKAIAPMAKEDNYDAQCCIRDNAKKTVRELPQKSEIVKNLVDSGKLRIVAAYYSMSTGKVDFYE